jgi:hypothetical protein
MLQGIKSEIGKSGRIGVSVNSADPTLILGAIFVYMIHISSNPDGLIPLGKGTI